MAYLGRQEEGGESKIVKNEETSFMDGPLSKLMFINLIYYLLESIVSRTQSF